MRVEATAAGEFQDFGVGEEGGDGCLDVFVLNEGDCLLAHVVIGGLDAVVLGRHCGLGFNLKRGSTLVLRELNGDIYV